VPTPGIKCPVFLDLTHPTAEVGLINEALRDHIQRPGLAQQVSAELRSVLREELEKIKVNA